MSPAPEHLMIAPILVPLVAGALMLFYEDRRAKRIIGLVAAGLLPIIAFALLDRAEAPSGGTEVGLYLLGDWPSPFAIVLVLGCGAHSPGSLPSTWSVPVSPRETISTTRKSAVVAKLMTIAVSTSACGTGST